MEACWIMQLSLMTEPFISLLKGFYLFAYSRMLEGTEEWANRISPRDAVSLDEALSGLTYSPLRFEWHVGVKLVSVSLCDGDSKGPPDGPLLFSARISFSLGKMLLAGICKHTNLNQMIWSAVAQLGGANSEHAGERDFSEIRLELAG